jgi:hypothetical protein
MNPKRSEMTSTSLPDDMFGRSMMSVRDVFSIFYHEIGPNERPYTAELSRLNNGLLEQWRDEILERMADEQGMVDAEKATISLKVYTDGLEVLALNEDFDFANLELELPPVFTLIEKMELADLWKKRSSWVLLSYETIMRSLKLQTAKDKYLTVYSKSDDIREWYRLSSRHRDLFSGGYEPFGVSTDRIKAVCEKIGCILQVTINPYK